MVFIISRNLSATVTTLLISEVMFATVLLITTNSNSINAKVCHYLLLHTTQYHSIENPIIFFSIA